MKDPRTDLIQKVNNNLFDNQAKQITAEMVREVFESVIQSYFNLIDDRLKHLFYDDGITLEQALDTQLVLMHSKTAIISVNSQGEGDYVSGSGPAVFRVSPNDGNHDAELWLQVTFPNTGADYVPIVSFEVTGTPWHTNNAVNVTYGNLTRTSMNIYLQKIFNNPFGRVSLTLLKV